ncbi:MAG: ribonuclease P protein component [Chlamydiales bacterium]
MARIRSKGHYQKIYYEGRKFSGTMVGAALRFGSSTGPKLGITVSKRHGKAHERNLFKRRVREAFRHTYPRLARQAEINIFPRLPIEKVTRAGIEADLLFFCPAK